MVFASREALSGSSVEVLQQRMLLDLNNYYLTEPLLASRPSQEGFDLASIRQLLRIARTTARACTP